MNLQKYILFLGCVFSQPLFAALYYSSQLCQQPDYFCIQTRANDTWEILFPDDDMRQIIQRLNRMNIKLKPGMQIAIPRTVEKINLYTLSPFPLNIDPPGEKVIYISQRELAWGAYEATGELHGWGPISSGSTKCQPPEACTTPVGFFRVIRKNDDTCVSTAFPQQVNDSETGGAPMPYCMHFFMGYALHGSEEVPGYPASHGCIRLFPEDAQWLNEEFIDLPSSDHKGTRVVVGDL